MDPIRAAALRDEFRPGASGFSITLTRNNDCMLAVVVGDIDALTVTDVARVFTAEPSAGVNALVVDLSRAGFCSVGGVRVLLELHERTNYEAVPLALVVDTRPVRRALEIVDRSERFSIHADRAAALDALSAA